MLFIEKENAVGMCIDIFTEFPPSYDFFFTYLQDYRNDFQKIH